MIPKKLHYCWFGEGTKSKIFEKCLLSWQQYCPDYEIIEWNEKNTKVYENKFYKNALRKKKYAFVADYIRARVLYEYGGIYLDTDMYLLKPIDVFLKYKFFSCEEVKGRVNFALFGTIKNHHFLKSMMEFYANHEFNRFSPPIITHTFSPLINHQTIKENEVILSSEYFYPLTFENRKKNYLDYISENSYAIHLWEHSWKDNENISLKFLLMNIKEITEDFLFHNYSFNYFKLNLKSLIRQIYHLSKSKINR